MMLVKATAARLAAIAVLALLLLPFLSHPAAAWWNSDWSFRMKVNADAGPKGAAVTDPIGRTQILLRLHSGNFNFATAKDDGTDLRFVAADDRTPLHYHFERYDGLVDQVGLVWIDIPDLAPGATTSFYVYWGNKNAAPASDSHASYDADQLLVYHFNDENGLPKDATGYGNNALTTGRRDEAGIVGPAIRLDGIATIRLPQSPSLAIPAGQPMTLSMWIRPNDGVTSGILYQQRDGANGLTIGLDQGIAYAQIETADGIKRTSAGTKLSGEGWRQIAVTVADKLSIYVDAQSAGEVAASLPAMAGAAVLGGALSATTPAATTPAATTPAATTPPAPAPAPAAGTPDAQQAGAPAPTSATPASVAAPAGFVGLIDELEISKVVRPLGALQIAVKDQGPQANLLGFDVPEEASVFGSGYVGIILRSVTPDAWVIIGILMVMALVSWWVMASKTVYLNQTGSANRTFRATLRRARAAPAASAFGRIETSKGLKRSSLYRLYETGAEELDGRLRGGQSSLAPQTIAAIRSSMDAVLIGETQRLNRLMVLLTIAISGGPFLGLLGTVVGVMITFAAIAQAGDVNVNAIAPGISAALLATVAGLFVAIPALFGYNYLTIRIRDATQDMQVFVDELATRMAEEFRARLPQAGE